MVSDTNESKFKFLETNLEMQCTCLNVIVVSKEDTKKF